MNNTSCFPIEVTGSGVVAIPVNPIGGTLTIAHPVKFANLRAILFTDFESPVSVSEATYWNVCCSVRNDGATTNTTFTVAYSVDGVVYDTYELYGMDKGREVPMPPTQFAFDTVGTHTRLYVMRIMETRLLNQMNMIMERL